MRYKTRGYTCYDSSSRHIIPTLKRDVNYLDGDGIAVMLDPINRQANGQRVPTQSCTKLNGNLNKSLRINALNMQTAKTDGQSAYNYSAVAFQQSLVGRSFIKLNFLNRQGFSDGTFSKTDYARDLGGELAFTSKNNQWDAWTLFHHSIQHDVKNRNNFAEGGFWYHNERWEFLNQSSLVGPNYSTVWIFFSALTIMMPCSTLLLGLVTSKTPRFGVTATFQKKQAPSPESSFNLSCNLSGILTIL